MSIECDTYDSRAPAERNSESRQISYRDPFKRNFISGVELIERGYETDVALASQIDVSCSVPILDDKAYVNSARLETHAIDN